MRASQSSGVIAWLAVLVIVLSVVGATCTAHGQCIGGMCPMPPNYGHGWRPGTPPGHYTQPRPYVCRIRNQVGRAASAGTGTLVCVGSDYGAVITCAHLFREGAGRVRAREKISWAILLNPRKRSALGFNISPC